MSEEEVVSNVSQESPVLDSAQVQEPEAVAPETRKLILKHMLKTELNKHYTQLINYINTMPVNDASKEYAFFNLDQGMFWLRDGIDRLEFEIVPPPQESNHVEETEASKEQENACEEEKGVLENAVEERIQQENNCGEHSEGSSCGQAIETSASDSSKCSQASEESQTA